MAARDANRNSGNLETLTEVRVSVKYLEKSLDALQRATDDQTKTLLAALDNHADDDSRRFGENDKRFSENDIRLKNLEHWYWYVLGAVATVGVGGTVIAYLMR